MMTSQDVKDKINNGIKNSKTRRYIRTIILYGSWARGRADDKSDIDIFVVCDSYSEKISNKIDLSISNAFDGYNTDVSIYDAHKFETLLECGSLYLHHLYDEGKIVYVRDRKYSKAYLFGKLREFKGISEDMLLYRRMLESTIKSIQNNGTNYFDLNTLAVLARNTMILICYFEHNHQYGKMEVYDTCQKMLQEKFRFNREDYIKLNEYRSFYNRNNITVSLPSYEKTMCYIEQVDTVIELGLELLGISDSIDRLYYLFKDNPGRNLYTSFELFTNFNRDMYMALNKYLMKTYSISTPSIEELFIEKLNNKYSNDDFIKCVYKVLVDMSEIKKKSSNYSIDCPDAYTEIKQWSDVSTKQILNDALKYLCKSYYLSKLLSKFINEDKNTIVEELAYLREKIKAI